jgi:DNA-directed RNA polymerase specialized sigma24 family protein
MRRWDVDRPVTLDRKTFLSDPTLLSALGAHVRSRVPSADAEDVVQSVLADALIADGAPQDDAEALRRWLYGVARHKIADFYRRTRREQPTDDMGALESPSSGRASGKDLLTWAENELPPGSEAKRTFEWMLREGDGEKLESIAASEKLPAPRVRKRVSRMREHFRARWAAYVAGLVAAGLAVIVALYVFRKKPEPEARIAPDSPLELAQKERRRALEACDEARSRADTPKGLSSRAAWKECIDGLDRAAVGDPAGEADPRVVHARDDALKALTPPSLPSAAPLPIPSATTFPRAIPTVTAPTTIPRPRNTSSTTPASSGFGSGP